MYCSSLYNGYVASGRNLKTEGKNAESALELYGELHNSRAKNKLLFYKTLCQERHSHSLNIPFLEYYMQ